MLEMYIDPIEVLKLCDMVDYDGHNVFWYLDQFSLYNVLDCRILDRIIQNKWNGQFDINAAFADYSTGFVMCKDAHNIFVSALVLQEVQYEMFTLNRGH